jgi:hypothetical protein
MVHQRNFFLIVANITALLLLLLVTAMRMYIQSMIGEESALTAIKCAEKESQHSTLLSIAALLVII